MKNLQTMVLLYSVCQISAQELVDIKLINNYFLRHLNVDILGRIAYYLPFDDRETDDEFVSRTSLLKEVKDEHKNKFLDAIDANQSCLKSTLWSYSVDGNSLIRFREASLLSKKGRVGHAPPTSLTTIYNLKTGASRDISGFTKAFYFSPTIMCCAFSRCEDQCVQLLRKYTLNDNSASAIRKQYSRRGTDKEGYVDEHYELSCAMAGGEKVVATFQISDMLADFVSVAFNKQGTKIILYARKNGDPLEDHTDSTGCFYHIFPLVSEAAHEEKSKKTWNLYFGQMFDKYKRLGKQTKEG